MTLRLQMTALCAGMLLFDRTGASAPISATSAALIITAGDPSNARYAVPAGLGLDGVGRMFIDNPNGQALCSGSLLSSGRHVLTAAHCVTDAQGVVNAFASVVAFTSSSGVETLGVSDYSVHPEWTGDFRHGADLAVLTLNRPASAHIDRYDIFREASEVGSVVDIVGYGVTGTGATGLGDFDGLRRRGRNTMDATLTETLGRFGEFTAGSKVLMSDFDDGSSAHDALGFFFGIRNTGLGLDEVNPAPGDSGSPGLIGRRIAGVSSFGTRRVHPSGSTSDVDSILNWSFGEMSGFTRVSAYDDWIDRQLTAIPEPGTLSLVLMSLCAIVYTLYSDR